MRLQGQVFFHDFKEEIYYLVNFQERRYMKIAEKGSLYYPLCERLYCHRWEDAETYHKVLSTCRRVDRLEQIDGSED